MSQHDLNIANQSFPSFRSDLNNALSAIQTTHSGTSRPTGAVAGQIWLDTTSATSPTLKYYDGADDISLATIDHSANTVNWLDSTVSITGLATTATGTVLTLTDTHLNSTVSIRIPTTKGIDDDSGNEFLKFTKTASAVNEFTIINSATGSAPEIQSTGDDTNIDLKITPKGSGKIILDGLAFPNADGTASQVLQTNGSGVLSFATPTGGTNTPAFSVTRTSGQTLTTGVTTKIQGNIELLDSNANYDNATNYRFTPTTSGFYQFNLCCQPSRTDSNVLEGLSIYIYKNGSNALSNSFGIDASDQNVFGYSISGVLEANGTTDYFEAFINFSVGTGTPSIGTANGTASFNFSGFKIIQ